MVGNSGHVFQAPFIDESKAHLQREAGVRWCRWGRKSFSFNKMMPRENLHFLNWIFLLQGSEVKDFPSKTFSSSFHQNVAVMFYVFFVQDIITLKVWEIFKPNLGLTLLRIFLPKPLAFCKLLQINGNK